MLLGLVAADVGVPSRKVEFGIHPRRSSSDGVV